MASEIVVGYDGSDGSKAALEQATEIAKGLGDKLVVVFGFEPYRPGGEVQDHAAAVKEMGDKALAEAAERAKAAGVDIETLYVDQRASQALADTASQRKARMIVVGTYGEHALKAAVLGSVPTKLLQISETPVLAVPA
jgi:nucleotide-binding universal stress UspA family protein